VLGLKVDSLNATHSKTPRCRRLEVVAQQTDRYGNTENCAMPLFYEPQRARMDGRRQLHDARIVWFVERLGTSSKRISPASTVASGVGCYECVQELSSCSMRCCVVSEVYGVDRLVVQLDGTTGVARLCKPHHHETLQSSRQQPLGCFKGTFITWKIPKSFSA
jgi:hypothetical protein